MKKNDVVKLNITDVGNSGEGIGKLDGFPVFVKGALPGDIARVRLTKLKKSYGYGRLEEIITPSPDRIKSPCPVSEKCGGCVFGAWSYDRELEWKNEKVKNALIRIGGFERAFIEEIMEEPIGADSGKEYSYRNKTQLPVGRAKDGRIITGFYAGRTHAIIENNACLLTERDNSDIVRIVINHMEKYGIDSYDENTGQGLVRHILVRTGEGVMVCLIINGNKIPLEDELADELWSISGMASVLINTNTANTNVILGEKIRVLKGVDYITDTMGELSFRIGAKSFYQVNRTQALKVYEKALDYAQLSGRETVFDLYCGIGTISLFMARRAGFVYGVEIVPEAIENAKSNAALNNINNAEFFAGTAEEVLPELLASHPDIHPDVIVVDPPRKGCDEKLLHTMLSAAPDRIVYVSCDPATLARDLKILSAGGYELRNVTAADQFGRSGHVEVVSLLQRVSNTRERTITLDVEMEDYHRIVNGDDHNK